MPTVRTKKIVEKKNLLSPVGVVLMCVQYRGLVTDAFMYFNMAEQALTRFCRVFWSGPHIWGDEEQHEE